MADGYPLATADDDVPSLLVKVEQTMIEIAEKLGNDQVQFFSPNAVVAVGKIGSYLLPFPLDHDKSVANLVNFLSQFGMFFANVNYAIH